jgi:hypothetical protein
MAIVWRALIIDHRPIFVGEGEGLIAKSAKTAMVRKSFNRGGRGWNLKIGRTEFCNHRLHRVHRLGNGQLVSEPHPEIRVHRTGVAFTRYTRPGWVRSSG